MSRRARGRTRSGRQAVTASYYGTVVDDPVAPDESNYSIPGGATVVSTMDQLATALNGTSAVDISVAAGTYTRPAAIADMAAPTLSQSGTGGTLAAGTYTYLVTALNAQGETMGAVQSVVIGSGTTNKVTISWAAHGSGTVTGYRVYGRSGVSTALRRLATQPSGTTTTVDDTGTTITSTTAPPTRNSTSGYIRPGASHRLYAQSADGVTYDFGLMIANSTGVKVKGGVFDISDVAKLADDGSGNTGAVVQFISGSNTARNLEVTDVTIDLHSVGKFGVFAAQPGGAVLQRIVADRCTDEGIYAYNNGPSTVAGWLSTTVTIDTITDIDVSRIYRDPRGDADGQHEYGIVIGHSVTNTVARLRGRDLGWAGLMTIGKVHDTVFEDLDFDVIYGTIPEDSPTSNDGGKITGQALYIERTTRRCTFRRVKCGATGDIQRGAANEWDENQNYLLTATYTIGNATMTVDHGRFDAQVPTSGTVYIGESDSPVAVTYTGWNAGAKQFTGCSGGSGGPYPAGTFVSTWPGGRHASTDCLYEDWYVNASTVREPARNRRGITFDDGTMRPTVRRVSIRGTDDYAILDNTNVPHAQSEGASNATFEDLDTSGINTGSVAIGYPAS